MAYVRMPSLACPANIDSIEKRFRAQISLAQGASTQHMQGTSITSFCCEKACQAPRSWSLRSIDVVNFLPCPECPHPPRFVYKEGFDFYLLKNIFRSMPLCMYFSFSTPQLSQFCTRASLCFPKKPYTLAGFEPWPSVGLDLFA
jgi:hypothetical protein